jgi:hypothetical protein
MKEERSGPPCWYRAVFYAAEWPGPDFADRRIRLERDHRRRVRKHGKAKATAHALKSAGFYMAIAVWRTVELVGLVLRLRAK